MEEKTIKARLGLKRGDGEEAEKEENKWEREYWQVGARGKTEMMPILVQYRFSRASVSLRM